MTICVRPMGNDMNRLRPRGPAGVLALLALLIGLAACPPVAATRAAEAPVAPGSPGEIRRYLGHSDPVLDVAFLPDGKRFVSCSGSPGKPGSDNSVRLWDVETGREIRRMEGHQDDVMTVAVTPDGRTALSGGMDQVVRFWDLETGREVHRPHDHRAVILDLAISADGRHALTGSWDFAPIVEWDVPVGKAIRRFGGKDAPVEGVSFGPDGRRLLAGHGDGTVRLWDFDSGGELRRFAGHTARVMSVAFAPDGRTGLSCSLDGSIRVWEIETGRELRRHELHGGPVHRLALSPDGRRGLSSGDDGTILLWEVETGRILASFETPGVLVASVSFSPDGRRGLAAYWDRSIRLWDLTIAPREAEEALAILDFADLGPAVELAVLRKALAEMLVGDLSPYRGLRVVERGRVEHFLHEAQLGKAGLVDEETARRAGRELAADVLLWGSIAGSEGKITVKAALRRVGAASPMAEWTLGAPAGRLFDLERDLAEKVRSALGLGRAATRPPPEPRPGDSPTLAVLGFSNLSPSARLQPMEAGFAEILQANLGGLKDVKLVERSRLDAVLREQKLTLAGLVDPATAVKVGRLLGAQRLIFGSFIEIGPDLRIETRLVDVATASVLRTETARGTTEQFADLFEGLAVRLATDLAIAPPGDAAKLVRAATPTRKLEAAGHFAAGEELSRQGNHADSAAAFERVLLLEPDNVVAHSGRTRGLYQAGQFARAIEAADQALTRSFTPQQIRARDQIRSWLFWCLHATRQYGRHMELAEEVIAEEPRGRQANTMRMGVVQDLMELKRHREAVTLLKRVVAEEKAAGDQFGYEDLLRKSFYQLESSTQRSPDSKAVAGMAVELFELLMKTAEEHRTPDWDIFAGGIAGALSITYLDQRRSVREYLTEEQKVDYARRAFKIFPDLPRVKWEIYPILAKSLAALGRWDEAREAYRYLAERADDATAEILPSWWEDRWVARTHWLNRVIAARVEAAAILGGHLDDKPGAALEYQAILRDYGLAHQQGARLALALKDHGKAVEFPKKCALIVGGAADGWRAWARVLRPLGYEVHPYDLDLLTAANLAPYSLVVLARHGDIAWRPSEAMAFRSYAAVGGSLLVVTSPGWMGAAPGLANPLLSFFGVHARGEALPVRIWGNLSDDHPLVKGLVREGVMAKCAVALDAPAESMAVRWYDKKVVVALPYREGRVVVTTLGQWFHPDTSGLGEWRRSTPLRANGIDTDQLPPESGAGLQIPLLRNVVAWLAEPAATRPGGRLLPEDFLRAYRAALEVQYGLRPPEELRGVLDAFVAGAGARREEALWAAGEALKPQQWVQNGDMLFYGWKAAAGPPKLDPRHLEDLVREFPRGELRPFAQWEAAEFARITRFREFDASNGYEWVDSAVSVDGLAAAFAKVEAPKGSYAWAWARIRLAQLELQANRPAEALGHARAVADVMDPGAEKILALFLAGAGAEALDQPDDAARYYESAMAAPDVLFFRDREDDAWSLLHLARPPHRFRYWSGPTKSVAGRWIQDLKRAKP